MPAFGIEYTWYRRFADGKVEHEFDPATGAPTKWGIDTPPGIAEVGWLPMTPKLAGLIAAYGEKGVPIQAPVQAIQLKEGETPHVERDRTDQVGALVTCKCCGGKFLSSEIPTKCLKCGVEPMEGKASPFELQQAEWQTAIYELGVVGRFTQRFNRLVSVTQ